MKKLLQSALADWLLTWLLCCALAALGDRLLRLQTPMALAVILLLLWCAALAAAEHWFGLPGRLGLLVPALVLGILFLDREALYALLTAVLGGLAPEEPGATGTAVLLLAVGALSVPALSLLRRFPFRAGLSLVWTAVWILGAVLEWALPRVALAALAPLLLLSLTEAMARRRTEQPPEKLWRGLLLSLLPAALLLMVLPSRAEPYDYPLLTRVAEAVEEFWQRSVLHREADADDFGLYFNGYTDRGDPGTGADARDRQIVYANPRNDTEGAVYLLGNTWDSFDGRYWHSTLPENVEQRLNWSLDTAEHIYAFWRLEQEGGELVLSDCFRENSVYLTYANLRTRTLFTAPNTLHVSTENARWPFAAARNGTRFEHLQSEGTWYRVYWLEANPRTERALIEAAEGYDYPENVRTVWTTLAKAYAGDFHLDVSNVIRLNEVMGEREVLIRRHYLDMSGVSDRARALAEELCADCETDLERLEAIAAYLRGNFSYTLTPEPVPEGESFLDWLLFERREGYCTWYATAATLLARSVGVPARYAQGYCSTLPGEQFTALRGGDSHAWCQGYIQGYGWVTVEATPGYSQTGEGWETAAEREAAQATEEPVPDEGPEPGAEAQTGEGAGEIGPGGSLPGVLPGGEAPAETPRGSAWIVVLPAALALGFAAVALLLYRRRKRAFEAAPPEEKLRLRLRTLLRDLRRRGYPRQPEESLREYFARLPWRWMPAREDQAMALAQLCERAFFGGVPPTEAELAEQAHFFEVFRPRGLRRFLRR